MAKQRILIVDSDQKTLRVLEASLLKASYSVTTSLDGTDALEKIKISPPDLIISEVVLPQMSGYDFCKKIKEIPATKNIPFIFLARLKSVGDKVKGLELGADDYLTKPIYLKEVLTRLKLLLEKKEREKIEMGVTQAKLAGSLSDIGLVDLIQTLEMGNKSAEVRLTKGEKKAALYFKKGKIVDAELGNMSGESALYRLLNWSEGAFRVDFSDITREDKVGKSNQALVMEGMRRIDEIVRIQEEIPSSEHVLVIDSQAVLSEHPQRFPVKIESLMAEFDGKATVEEVIDKSGYDELEAYEIIAKLYFQGFLVDSGQTVSKAPLIFQKPPEQPPVEEVESSFLRPPIDVAEEEVSFSKPGGASEAEESFMSPPVETHEEVEVLGPAEEIGTKAPAKVEEYSYKEQPATKKEERPAKKEPPPQKDSKVIFLKPAQLAEKFNIKEPAKAPRDFWKDEPLITSLEKVLSAPEAVPKPAIQPPEGRPAIQAADSRGLRVGVEKMPLSRGRTDVASVYTGASRDRVVWKILAIIAPSLVLVTVLYMGRDYIITRLSKVSAVSRDDGLKGKPVESDAEALINAGRDREALAVLDKALAKNPNNPRGYYLRGVVRSKNPATFQQGIEDLRQALVLSPGDKEVLVTLGEKLLGKKDVADAIIFLKKAVDLDPDLSRAYRLLGSCYMEKGETETALTMFRKCLDRDPKDNGARLSISKVYFDIGSLEKANDNLRIILSQADPQKEKDVIAEARRYMNMVEAKSSPVVSSRSREKAAPPRSVPKGDEYVAHHKKGRALYEEGKVKEAIVEYRLALLLAPQNAAILVDLGNALFDDGDDKGAIESLQKALAIDPRNSRAHLSLGGIYSTVGEKAKAIDHYRRFLEIEPTGPSAGEVRTILKNLGG